MRPASTGPAIVRSIGLNSSAASVRAAAAMVMAQTSPIDLPPRRTSSASLRSRAPPHSVQASAVWNFFTTKRLPME